MSLARARAPASLVGFAYLATVAALAALATLVTGCGAAAHSRAAGAVAPLAIHEVPWNRSGSAIAIGPLRAVVDNGTRVALFGAGGMVLFAGGAPVLTDRSVVDWKDGAVVRGPEGAPVIVGVDGAGRVFALRALARFEDVSARYALGGFRVRAAVALDAAHVGFLTDGAVTVVDGRHSRRFAAGTLGPSSLAGGGGFGAVVSGDGLRLFDASSLEVHRYALVGVTAAAVGADGRFYVMTARALYAQQPAGDLALVFDAQASALHGLAASGKRVWFGDGDRLGFVDGERVAEAEPMIAPDAKLAASPSGDVWVIDHEGARRFSADVSGETDAWAATLAPIFARACASCHRPGGVSGTDLSSVDAWRAERAAIEARVVIQHQMPPEGHPISDADREAIHAWAQGLSN